MLSVMLPSLARAERFAERLCHIASSSTKQCSRNTWVLQRLYVPEATVENKDHLLIQRDPSELKELERYEVVEYETQKPAGPVEVILLEDVEGIGHQFDVVKVSRYTARSNLLLTRKAVYASPFDLQYYARMKERMADELAHRVRIPYNLLSIGRSLQNMVTLLHVNMENKWSIDKHVLRTSLSQAGVEVPPESIFIPNESALTGPNFELEARLLRFYVVINQQYVVPMLGRITHISSDESKQVLAPDQVKLPTDADLAKCGLRKEEPYFHKDATIDETFDVVHLMKNRQ